MATRKFDMVLLVNMGQLDLEDWRTIVFLLIVLLHKTKPCIYPVFQNSTNSFQYSVINSGKYNTKLESV